MKNTERKIFPVKHIVFNRTNDNEKQQEINILSNKKISFLRYMLHANLGLFVASENDI
jgi:hypothetical protein